MKEILQQQMFKSGSHRAHPDNTNLYQVLEVSMQRDNSEELHEALVTSRKRHHDDQDPPLPPPKILTKARRKSMIRMHLLQNCLKLRRPPLQRFRTQEKLPLAPPIKRLSLNIKIRPDWLKPVQEEERSKTPKPDWAVPPNELPKSKNNWANALANAYKDPEENKKSKLSKADLEGAAFKLINLVNPEGNRVVPDVSKPLPLRGPPGQVTIQAEYFFNKDLEYLVSSEKDRRNALSISKLKVANYLDFRLEELFPSLWIKSKCGYNISAAYGISHWWFKRKEFYITRHSAPSDYRAVRSYMQILSVVSLKTYTRYGYTFLKEIVLRRADYKEHKISEADFKNLHPNDFEDLYLLHLQGKLNHLSGAEKPRAIIYKDRNDQKKMMRETEVNKFSDGTLIRILKKLDHMIKDFVLFKFNPGMEHRIWSEDDKRRSKEFIEVIERRLIRRIFRSLESFVG
ncbi:hypothetical protein Tco_1068529 [Tanacetum coccineum]|uniref:Uncharacterized protein n=1 Tax=Tanacetum coccineum TaxID=301880 RepID=A0ABQ5HHW2_9ASTR